MRFFLHVFACLSLLICAGSASGQQPQPDFDNGADIADTMAAARSGGQELPAPGAGIFGRQLFRYHVDHYPAAGGSCAAAAKRVGEAVEKIAGVRTVSAECENADETGYAITVNYEAAERLATVTTAGSGSYTGGFGKFVTEQACAAELATETAVFRDRTGLEPVVSFCFHDKNTKDDYWSILTESLGAGKLKPFNSRALTFSLPDMPQKDFLARIKDRMTEQGLDVRYVSWLADFGYATINASYYAAGSVKLTLEEAARLDTRERCEAMLADANRALAGRSPAPLITYCGKSAMQEYEATWIFTGRPGLRLFETKEEFKSYADCLAGRDRTAEYYRTAMSRPVAGALCGKDAMSFSWKVTLLEDWPAPKP